MEVTSLKDTISDLKRDLERVRGQFDEQDDELNDLIHHTRRGNPFLHTGTPQRLNSTHSHECSLNSLPGIKGIANELGDKEVSCLFVQGCKQGGTMQRYDITEKKKNSIIQSVLNWFERLKFNLPLHFYSSFICTSFGLYNACYE